VQPSPRARRAHPRSLRVMAAAALAAALPLLSGCASNFDSPVLQDYNPVTGVNVREDGVWGMNMLVVFDEASGRGTLVGTLLNTTRAEDRLVEASVTLGPDDEGELTSSLVRSSVPLPPERLVQLSDPQTVQVEGEVEPGLFVGLTLQFQRSEPIEVQVPVVPPEAPYADVPLAPEPSPAPTAEAETPAPEESGQGGQGEGGASPEGQG
jgi:hypothetical protein